MARPVTCTRNVTFLRKGADGQSAVRYWIVTSVSQVRKSASGTLSANQLAATKMKQVGQGLPAVTSDLSLYFQIALNSGTTSALTAYTSPITLNTTMSSVTFYLKNGTTDVDTCTVLITADGSNGSNGNWTSYAFKQSNTQPSRPTDNSTIPSGWADYPTSTGRWWMSMAIISGSTGLPIANAQGHKWSTPTQVTAEDGVNGTYIDFRFAVFDSNSIIDVAINQGNVNPGNNWKNDPPAVGAGEYLWMTKAVMNGETNQPIIGDDGYWSEPVCISGEKGDDGTSPIILDLDNENVSIPCNSAGTVLSGLPFTSNATLYDGMNAVPTSDIEWSCTPSSTCSATCVNGLVTVTAIASDTEYVDVKAKYNDVTYSTRLTISKVKGGANGTSPSIYSLEPSVNVIHKDSAGNLSVSSVTCKKIKTTGTSRVETTEKYLWYVVETANAATTGAYSGAVSVSNTTKAVTFYLYQDSSKTTLLDKEYIPVVADGTTGPRGYMGAKYRFSNWVDVAEGDWFYPGASGDEYFDVVLYKEERFLCKAKHRKPSGSTPTPQNDSTNWQKVTWWPALATELLLGTNSVINFMQGNQLLVYNESENLKAGITSLAGDYPIVFANPRKASINVDVLFGSSSSNTTTPTNWVRNGFPTINTSMKYLSAKLEIKWSDGTTTETSHLSMLEFSSTIPNRFKTEFAIDSQANLPSTGWATGLIQPTEDKPYGFAKVSIYNNNSVIGNVQSFACGHYYPSDNTLTSLFQVLKSGEVLIGEREGARIVLRPQFDKGLGVLPRMEIYNTDDEISALFDGSVVNDASDLYGGSSSNASVTSGKTATASVPAGYNYQPTTITANVFTTTIVCASPGTLRVNTLNGSFDGANGIFLGGSSIPPGLQNGTIELLVDGTVIRQRSFYFDTEVSGYFSFATKTIAVGAGTHTITLRVKVWGFTDAYARATTSNNLSVTFNADKYISRYFANGYCLGSGGGNHLSVLNKNNSMEFEFVSNAQHGIRINSGGVSQMQNGKWLGNQLSTILAAFVTTTPAISGCKTWNGTTPTVAKNGNDITIAFPSNWSELGIGTGTANVQVTPYGSGSPYVKSLSSSSVIINSSGSFFIEIKYVG